MLAPEERSSTTFSSTVSPGYAFWAMNPRGLRTVVKVTVEASTQLAPGQSASDSQGSPVSLHTLSTGSPRPRLQPAAQAITSRAASVRALGSILFMLGEYTRTLRILQPSPGCGLQLAI